MPDRVIKSERLTVERKDFEISLRENDRGQFVRIDETRGPRRNSVIVPWEGLDDFRRTLDNLVEGEEE